LGPSLLSTASTLETGVPGHEGATTKKVPLTSLDIHFADARVDLIKIDVEGHEPHVLDGARQVLERDHPSLMLEILRSTPLPALLGVLEPLGYEASWVTEADGKLQPLSAERPPKSRNALFVHPERKDSVACPPPACQTPSPGWLRRRMASIPARTSG
jgi:hypothetical protein